MSIALFPLLLTAALPVVIPSPSRNDRLLSAHNAERQLLGVAPLKWDATLAAHAALWADHLAKTDTFEHAAQNAEGENLWAGTKDAYPPEEMVGSWIDEKSLFIRGKFPKSSTTGDWKDVGHYTQLIWYNTTKVGCAIGSNKQEDFLVCRYGPPGNWIGQNPLGESTSPKTVRKAVKMNIK